MRTVIRGFAAALLVLVSGATLQAQVPGAPAIQRADMDKQAKRPLLAAVAPSDSTVKLA